MRPVTHVLLFPEDVAGGLPNSSPAYGVVTGARNGLSSVDLKVTPAVTVRVRSSLVSSRRVDSTEAADGAVGLWLRRAVVGIQNGSYVYGQVIAYTTDDVTVRGAAGVFSSPVDDLQEIAPVLCFLMSNARVSADDVPADELAQQHVTILDRLLGRQAHAARSRRAGNEPPRGTRSIPKLLAGLVPPAQHPSPDDSLTWTNATSGTDAMVSTRHAVDFAYYVDGGRPIPPRLRPTIGESFDDDPSCRVVPPPRTTRIAGRQHVAAPAGGLGRPRRRDDPPPDVDDLPLAFDDPATELQALLDAVGTPADRPASAPASTTARPASPRTDADLHGRILAAIVDDPNLVRFYLSVCQSDSRKRSADTVDLQPAQRRRLEPSNHDELPASQRRRLESPSDLVEAFDAHDRRSKTAFSPNRIQQGVNGLIIATDHSGKDPAALVDAMLSSRATKFTPHPAIIIRVYAFEFGARGLSIMHFVRFDFAARRAWYAAAAVNMNNFGPTVMLPKASRPGSLDDLAGALTVLHLFVEEFMDPITCRLVSSAREFVEELRGFYTWSTQDVATLTFWFDCVFEAYRDAADHDVRFGTTTRALVRDRLSLRDHELQSTLYIMQAERYAFRAGPPREPGFSVPHSRADAPRAGPRERPPAKTPKDVLDALPRKGRLTVCMKYLSADGCSSKSDSRCAFPNHVHFLPAKLDPVVREHITKNMGGLREDLLA